MRNINSKNLYTDRLELRIPSMKEQHRLWEILVNDDINKYYYRIPDGIFENYNLSKENLEDLKKARKIFIERLNDWTIQEPIYKKKIESIKAQDDKQKYTWSIFLKETNTVIGQIVCPPINDEPENIREIGWFIDPNYQRQGYATEAAIAVLEFMFNEVEITDIKTSAAIINPASWRVMEKLGFEFVGTKKTLYSSDDEILIAKKYHGTKELFLNRNNTK